MHRLPTSPSARRAAGLTPVEPFDSGCAPARDKPPAARQRQRTAFTLVELLVVIGIIVLLVGILIPTMDSVLRVARAAESRARLTGLADACEHFARDHGGFYPGQIHTGELTGSTGGQFTGSQILAAELFNPDVDPDDASTYTSGNIEGAITAPDTTYAPCQLSDEPRDSDLFNPDDIARAGDYGDAPNSISDRFGRKPMAVLYFPSRRTGGLTQYRVGDNTEYLTDTTDPNNLRDGDAAWEGYIEDPRKSGMPYNDGRFILVGAGGDRQYGTKDDLTNIAGR